MGYSLFLNIGNVPCFSAISNIDPFLLFHRNFKMHFLLIICESVYFISEITDGDIKINVTFLVDLIFCDLMIML